jgi:predicted nucleic acid-binding protein
MLDTGVLIRALRRRIANDDERVCRMLFDALMVHKKDVLVAAPSLAEAIRYDANFDVPRTRYVNVVAFDQAAARLCGSKLPQTTLVEMRDKSGLPISYIKYDAMIVSCAIRHNADMIVSKDQGMVKLALVAGIRAATPKDFLSAQMGLFDDDALPPETRN